MLNTKSAHNRPFLSSILLLFQNESNCETIQSNEFDLHENKPVGRTHFHMNGFALRLVLTQRQKVTWKWPIFLFGPLVKVSY